MNAIVTTKKAMSTLALVLAISFALGGVALAATGGGFTGPGPSYVTVAQAKEMGDDAPVLLVGYIVQHLGKDDYLFKDKTGTLTLSIDQRHWQGQSIGPNDLVEVNGEVDKDFLEFEIDVYSITKK